MLLMLTASFTSPNQLLRKGKINVYMYLYFPTYNIINVWPVRFCVKHLFNIVSSDDFI